MAHLLSCSFLFKLIVKVSKKTSIWCASYVVATIYCFLFIVFYWHVMSGALSEGAFSMTKNIRVFNEISCLL